uniref:high affinity immunoglobulin epsilon receptor subunit gamma n=1 Tax=Euleptes europaea TaxID=460621 RepID=UPI0025412F33|nr:high affinity immunoglobulin epsilon receptor subunit gamma [Euleptes europaea]
MCSVGCGLSCRIEYSTAEAQLGCRTFAKPGARGAHSAGGWLRVRPSPSLGGRATARQNGSTQVSRMKLGLFTALLVLLTAEEAEALREPELCYILDGILFIYGIALTFLYCRLKILYRKKSKPEPSAIYEKVEGIYTGLDPDQTDTYTPLDLPKPEVPCKIPEEELRLE